MSNRKRIKPMSAAKAKRKTSNFQPNIPRLIVPVLPYLVYERQFDPVTYPRSNVQRFADKLRKNQTEAEKRFKQIICESAKIKIQNIMREQHAISGKWIVDFFFPEVRLAVEIDGGIHRRKAIAERDRLKERDCARLDITLLRITNEEVFGDRKKLLEKVREGWRCAKNRENKIIGSFR